MQSSSLQFLDAPPVDGDPAIGILPVPYEATTSYGQGTRNGPQSILESSAQVELYDEELDCEPYLQGVCTHDAVAGEGVAGEGMIEAVQTAVRGILQRKQWPLVLGGEHAISTAPILACREVHPDLAVLQIDAHGDLRHEYEGSIWSHACIMRRIFEAGIPSVGVGIRSLCTEERDLIREHKLPRWFAHQMMDNDDWMDAAIVALPEHVYITFDVDGLDPSIIRATGTPEPGGLGWNQTLRFLRKVFTERTVVGADVVELAPVAHDPASSFAAAKLVYKLIGYHGIR